MLRLHDLLVKVSHGEGRLMFHVERHQTMVLPRTVLTVLGRTVVQCQRGHYLLDLSVIG